MLAARALLQEFNINIINQVFEKFVANTNDYVGRNKNENK